MEVFLLQQWCATLGLSNVGEEIDCLRRLAGYYAQFIS